MITMGIEGAGRDLSIGLLRGEEVIYEEEMESERHDENILEMIGKVVRGSGVKKKEEIDLISINTGPGRYTSLRVIVGTVKALGQFGGYSVVGVNGLEILWEEYRGQKREELRGSGGYVVSMILDGNRVYSRVYQEEQLVMRDSEKEVLKFIEMVRSLEGRVSLIGLGVRDLEGMIGGWEAEAVVEAREYVQIKGKQVGYWGYRKYMEEGGSGYEGLEVNYAKTMNFRRSGAGRNF